METNSLYDLSKIKILAKQQDKNLIDIASAAGISPQSIHQMVRNNTARHSTLIKIADILGVPVDYFLRDSADTSIMMSSDCDPVEYAYEAKIDPDRTYPMPRTKDELLRKRQEIIDALKKKVDKLETRIKEQEETINLLKQSISDKETIIQLLLAKK